MMELDINFDNLQLIKPCMDYMPSFRAAVREHRQMRVEDFAYPNVTSTKAARAYLRNLEDQSRGRCLPRGFVPSTAFWLVDGVNYLGSSNIRHYLNESLKSFGGHIGYSIRPSAWGRNLGTIQLRLLLKEAKRMQIYRVRITCFDTNIASARVMEKNGAVLINKVVNLIDGRERLTRIYEIDLLHN